MKQINLRTFDLNLLRILVAMSETGSVSATADRIGLSQPATSNALGRLRKAVGDQLFVRSRKGMLPTSYAELILPDVKLHLDGIYDRLSPRSKFEPASSCRTFRLSLSGLGELVFLPRLAETIFGSAPNIRLHNMAIRATRLAAALENGDIDCAIGIINIQDRGINSLPLFSESYVAIAGGGLHRTPRTMQELRQERLAVSAPIVSYAQDMASLLRSHDLHQNVALQLANFDALPHLLGNLPLIAIVPRQFALQLEAAGTARLIPVELSQQESTARLIWSERTETDDGCRWIRKCIIKQFLDQKMIRGED